MDKRTILAIVLIGIVLLLSQMWLAPRPKVEKGISPEKEAVRERPVEEQVNGEKELGDKYRAVKEETRELAELEIGRDVVIENDLFIGKINTRGGVITSWRLKDFGGMDGGAVEVVPEGGGGLEVLWSEGGVARDLSGVEFVPDREGLRLTSKETGVIRFTADLGDGRKLEKRIRIAGDRYEIGLDIHAIGFGADDEVRLMWRKGIAITERNYKDDLHYTKFYTFAGGEVEEWDVKHSDRPIPSGPLDWVGVRNKYFLISVIPTDVKEYKLGISKGFGGEISGRFGKAKKKLYDFSLTSDVEGNGVISNLIYIGPLSYSALKSLGVGLEGVMDWGWDFFEPILKPIGKVILKVLILLHKAIPNYGLVIIVFSVLIKIVVYPLTHKSYEATANMQRLQPKIAELREKYRGDQQGLNREMMRLYKEEGFNPLGGCLPMLLQMPIFIALFNLFRNTIELRQAEFVLWIRDLSQPDPLHVLPVLMGVTMFIQQKMTMKDPKQTAMVYIMPVVMIFFFWGFSSGLVLYWTMFNILSSAQQALAGLSGREEEGQGVRQTRSSLRKYGGIR